MKQTNKDRTNKVPGYIQYNKYCGLKLIISFFLDFWYLNLTQVQKLTGRQLSKPT